MDMYKRYKSALGYELGDDGIDSYGVDHNGFSTRDELAYQFARDKREGKLLDYYQSQGINDNYPQYGTDFWGDNAADNYGFGSSEIEGKIDNHPAMNQTPFPKTRQTLGAQIRASSSSTNNNPNCYIEFNGQDVDLYKYGQNDGNRLQNGQLQYNLDGQSGGDDYQSGIHQNVPNKGPIPEGTYYADQDQRQSLTMNNIALKLGEKLGLNMKQKSDWSGNPISWGISRVWLRPDANTNTYGRSGFSIHGGLTKGSAGCIDIPWQTGKLNNYLDDCQDSVPVYVKYPKDW